MKLFRELLNVYRIKLSLPGTDKDVRNCVYFLRDGLYWLKKHKECGIEYV